MLMKQVHAKILVAIFILSALIGAQLATPGQKVSRSEEHTSELQSRLHLVCRLLLEKKKIFHFYIPKQMSNYWYLTVLGESPCGLVRGSRRAGTPSRLGREVPVLPCLGHSVIQRTNE